VGDAQALKVKREEPDWEGEEWSHGETEVDTVEEGAVAIFAAAGSEGLGDESV
jgi:hypothetical protein